MNILWDIANKELFQREIDTLNKEVIEYFNVTGKDTSTQKDWQAVAVYKNGYFETMINKEEA
jgi:hypothetical protein